MLWSLNSSEAVSAIMKESYKQSRHEDDLNQPLSVQPWGRDGDKRRYWLIEGQDDTHFRLYRESNPSLKHNTWWSVAGSIEELRVMADRLEEEGSQASRRLRERILGGIPRFEASDEVRIPLTGRSTVSQKTRMLTSGRNENAETTVSLGKPNSHAQSWASLFTKAVRVGSEYDTHSPMKRTKVLPMDPLRYHSRFWYLYTCRTSRSNLHSEWPTGQISTWRYLR